MKRIVASVDAWQRRHALGGFPIAVLKKFAEDRASNLAALSAYYAFFSLFPLLLAFVSILGFVLEGNPSLREDVVDTVARPDPGHRRRSSAARSSRSRVAASRSRSGSPARCGRVWA